MAEVQIRRQTAGAIPIDVVAMVGVVVEPFGDEVRRSTLARFAPARDRRPADDMIDRQSTEQRLDRLARIEHRPRIEFLPRLPAAAQSFERKRLR